MNIHYNCFIRDSYGHILHFWRKPQLVSRGGIYFYIITVLKCNNIQVLLKLNTCALTQENFQQKRKLLFTSYVFILSFKVLFAGFIS